MYGQEYSPNYRDLQCAAHCPKRRKVQHRWHRLERVSISRTHCEHLQRTNGNHLHVPTLKVSPQWANFARFDIVSTTNRSGFQGNATLFFIVWKSRDRTCLRLHGMGPRVTFDTTRTTTGYEKLERRDHKAESCVRPIFNVRYSHQQCLVEFSFGFWGALPAHKLSELQRRVNVWRRP